MLKLIKSGKELDFGALMAVYEEDNRENAGIFYPHLSENEGYLQAQADFYAYLRNVFFPTSGAVYAVWTEGGRYVSALRWEPWGDGLLLEALETAPAHRRRGYAKALMAAVLEALPEQTVYSHVDKKNAASLAVHRACGFERILEYARYADGSVLTGSCTLRRKARTAGK